MIIKKGNTGEQGTEKKLSRDSGLKACMRCWTAVMNNHRDDRIVEPHWDNAKI